jgi:hypothetical protein
MTLLCFNCQSDNEFICKINNIYLSIIKFLINDANLIGLG